MAVVTASWLQGELANQRDNILILDVTWYSAKDAHQDYLQKHIEGAQWFHIMEGAETSELFPRNLPSPASFQAQARRVGVNQDSHVVLYDNTPHCGFFVGSRAWWMFKVHGHQKVSVLEGGIANWESAGYPVTQAVTPAKEGNFTSQFSSSYIKRHDDMVANLTTKQFQVCDTRGEDAYKGKREDKRTGHYPGAANMTMATVLLDKQNNKLHSPSTLKQIFKERGVDLEKPIVTMCNSGMSSTSAAFAATLCGASDVAVYLGGFTEWGMKADDNQIEQLL